MMSNISSEEESQESELEDLPRRMQHIEVKIPPPDYARNRTPNYMPSRPITNEKDALEDFKAEWKKNSYDTPWPSTGNRDVMILELSNFEIYRSPGPPRSEYEFTALHFFDVKAKNLSLNGILSLGHVHHYLELVAIEETSIEGYGDDEDPSTKVYLQSRLYHKDHDFDIWFELKTPSKSYVRYYEPFIWVTEFGKHVIDFLESRHDSPVELRDFRNNFDSWLQKRYSNNRHLAAWRKAFGSSDFRVAINAYIDYLYNQAYNQADSRTILHHTVWAECLRGSHSVIKEQPQLCKKTIATPMVYECFKDMYFGKFLERMAPAEVVRIQQRRRKRTLGFPDDSDYILNASLSDSSDKAHRFPSPLKIGDVVGLSRDASGCWKGSGDWLAYIHEIVPKKNGDNVLKVIWLYRPGETLIKDMFYPFKKELFFSDHCNCSDPELLASEVTRQYSVDWQPASLNTKQYLFVRTTWLTSEDAFVSMKESHFHCSHCSCTRHHNVAQQPTYRRGDCVYILTNSKEKSDRDLVAPVLEPVVISNTVDDSNRVTVRKLLRLARVCSKMTIDGLGLPRKVAPNELVWTDECFKVPARRIVRKCHVRFFDIETVLSNKVPTPYDRRGNGDCWILSSKLEGSAAHQRVKCLSKPPTQLNEGFDPDAQLSYSPLRGLSIFSGGGNLDRGLEEGGAVRFETAIDISKEAVHTQKANALSNDHEIYYGSVDDYLKAVLSGKDITPFTRIGNVQFIAAGSPCPGFSSLQPDWKSDKSLRNASHITTLCSFLDVYRPEYALLENVVTMANTRRGHEEQNVFGQMVGCLVALGYQVAQFSIDAWSHSSSQRRSRLFLSITAPGLEPMRQPPLTHSHLHFRPRSLGKLPNGNTFGSREDCPTPFKYVTAEESTGHLPKISTGNVQICVPFPDHRLVQTTNKNDRALIQRIPTSPPGQGYVEAAKAGRVPELLKKTKSIPGKSFRRIKGAGHIPTITTTLSPQDAFVGEILHWVEHRPISIQEARGAQGIPDHEVIIGSLGKQWKVIGNAVDRNVALALGLALKWALEAKYTRPLPATKGANIVVVKDVSEEPNSQCGSNVDHSHETEKFEDPYSTALSMKFSHDPKSINLNVTSIPSTTRSTPLPTSQKRVREDDERIRAKSTDALMEPRKRTRQSGLQVEFKPSSWSKVPERVIKEAGASKT